MSPTFNFGRMPPGYRMSSGNNRRLVEAGKRFRGGTTKKRDSSHEPGVPPAGTLDGDPTSRDWCGHRWSEWVALMEIQIPGTGLYRIRRREKNVLYVGEGKVASRLRAHAAKTKKRGHLQGEILGDPETLECSWVLHKAWLPHQRLELETDLIAAHILATGKVPAVQFLG